MNIPIKNIYYMILYAFDKVKNKDSFSRKSYEKASTISDIFVILFLDEVSKIVRKGLYKNYKDIRDESLFIKGKINIKESMKPNTIKKVIEHDDFTATNHLNQIIKYTLNKIIRISTANGFSKKAKKLYYYFNDVDYKMVSKNDYKSVILNKVTSSYEFAYQLSIFINNKVIPEEHEGSLKFINIIEEDETMCIIYEQFLRNFYKIHTNYKVSSKEYDWYLTALNSKNDHWLPKMRTDIEVLKDEKTKIIIDAKFYRNALTSRYETKKLSSSNMYQMNTYLLHNLDYDNLTGILLYPSNGFTLNFDYESTLNFKLQFKTIDLNKDWENISSALLGFIK